MKVIFFTRRSWPAIGGIEALVRHLSLAVAANDEIEVRIIALRIDNGTISRTSDGPGLPQFDAFLDGPVSISPAPLTRIQNSALQPLRLLEMPGLRSASNGQVRTFLTRYYAQLVATNLANSFRGADLVHVWGLIPGSAAAIRASRMLGLPNVYTPFMHRGAWGDEPASVDTYRRADRVLALQTDEAEDYVAVGVPAERVVVSGACVPQVVQGHLPTINAWRSSKRHLVVYLGVRQPHKGVSLLLSAATLLRTPTDVAVVGPGDELTIPATHPDVNVVDVGRVCEEERATWLRSADLLVLPSESETFGLVLLEAWSVATPVLTSRIPSLRSLVERSGGGQACSRDAKSLAQSIESMLSDPERLLSMGQAGRRFWEQHCTPDRIAAWHVDLYRTLMDG
jgi:glycosyltransferase involved in cell wall biosynthesis